MRGHISGKAWTILIVDDEPEVHILTRTVLKNVHFDNRPLRFLSSFDAAQTRSILLEEQDIALILMDVVMEEEQTGLELIRYIREELGNQITRIILRTGQSGEAPERQVIIGYEINDYKEKVDLTAHRLFTAVVKSLRNYKDLIQISQINRTLERSRQDLTRVINASSDLFFMRSLEAFYIELMAQIRSLLGGCRNLMMTDLDSVLYSDGEWTDCSGEAASDLIPESVLNTIRENEQGGITQVEGYLVNRFMAARDFGPTLIADGCTDLTGDEQKVLGIFLANANIVYSNLSLEDESLATQTEMISLLGDMIENRSHELQGHVTRVREYAVFLARQLNIPEEEIAILRDAVPLHDIGKIGIYDAILQKPGPLTPEEFETMKQHTVIGYKILRYSSHKLFQMAAIIAREHHERWDGKGYPRGLLGDRIHLLGRITCIVDVFDALTSDRVYRKAWSFEKTVKFLQDGKGSQFDPHLVDLFLEDPEKIRSIMVRYSDKVEEPYGEENRITQSGVC